MTQKERYGEEVKNQIAKGIDFNMSVWNSDASYFEEIAKRYHYKRSKTSYFGTGRSFYELLQRVYNRMKKDGDIK